MVVDGIETTLPLFRALVREPDIIDGDYHIHWLEQFLATGGMQSEPLRLLSNLPFELNLLRVVALRGWIALRVHNTRGVTMINRALACAAVRARLAAADDVSAKGFAGHVSAAITAFTTTATAAGLAAGS